MNTTLITMPDILDSPHLEEAKKRIIKGKANLKSIYFKKDEHDRDFIDTNGLMAFREDQRIIKDQEALQWHRNDPNIRLDDCGFPKDRQDRNFILNHDFGKQVSMITGQIKNGKWVYLYGGWGLGKTSLATRVIWEFIKPYPSVKATYISVNHWINDQMPEGKKHMPELHNLILLDDFDKFEARSEFQNRTLLRLIENIKEMGANVILTSQYSLDELLNKNRLNVDLNALIDRVRGKSFVFNKFIGESKR